MTQTVQIKGAGGVQRVDGATGGAVVVDPAAERAGLGHAFLATVLRQPLPLGSTSLVLVRTPPATPVHLSLTVRAGQPLIAGLFEAPTLLLDGTPITDAANRNRGSAATPAVLLFDGPTVSAVGTTVAEQIHHGGGAGAMRLPEAGDVVLAPDADYAVGLTNRHSAPHDVSVLLDWYERLPV